MYRLGLLLLCFWLPLSAPWATDSPTGWLCDDEHSVPHPCPGPPPASSGVGGLPIRPESSRYDRDVFRYDSRIARQVLADSLPVLWSPLEMRCFDKADGRSWDLDHLVSLKEAHDSGLSLDPAVRQAFAMDPENWLPMTPSLNREVKSAADVAEWTPGLDTDAGRANECWHARQVIRVKRKYGLDVDVAEHTRLQEMLAHCPGPLVPLPVAPDCVERATLGWQGAPAFDQPPVSPTHEEVPMKSSHIGAAVAAAGLALSAPAGHGAPLVALTHCSTGVALWLDPDVVAGVIPSDSAGGCPQVFIPGNRGKPVQVRETPEEAARIINAGRTPGSAMSQPSMSPAAGQVPVPSAAPVQPGARPAPSQQGQSGQDALSLYDSNGNGRISCKEAREHGIAPVMREHPAYPFMRDGNNDGRVC